jgi:hypothetical protein
MADKKTVIEQREDIGTLIGLVAGQEYSDATGLATDLLNARVAASLDEYKQHVAKNLFTPAPLAEEDEKDKEDEKEEKEDDKEEKDDEDEDEKEEKKDK